MILQYFKKKENKEKDIAENIYKFILKKSNTFLDKNNFFVNKDYNTSFESVSIFIILYIKVNIYKKINNQKLINEHLVSTFISDLDESLRVKGISDMSIGKYVKAYVKKFYFRLSIFPKIDNKNLKEEIENYLQKFDLIISGKHADAASEIIQIYDDINMNIQSE